MKTFFGVSIMLLVFIQASAQEYSIRTNETDSFSKAFVQLLQCAADKFENCRGKFLQYTMLQENEFELAIPFPGSSAGIIRYRENDKNAYVEFRGFDNKESLIKGMYFLIDKIKKALNGEIIEPTIYGIDEKPGLQITGISIKDNNGFYQSNIELFTGSSAGIYLLPAVNNEKDNGSNQYFILLKIYSGVPAYYHNISADVKSPDKKMSGALKELVIAAATDFESLQSQQNKKIRRSRDTFLLDGFKVYKNTAGQNATSSLKFPITIDSIEMKRQIAWCQQVIESAVGDEYVYYLSNMNQSLIFYFSKKYEISRPAVELTIEPGSNSKEQFLQIIIRSNHSKEVKRSLGVE